jgi:myosin-5
MLGLWNDAHAILSCKIIPRTDVTFFNHIFPWHKVFDYLVKKINVYTEPPDTHTEYGTISLLDIFGFESFAVNRFEQVRKSSWNFYLTPQQDGLFSPQLCSLLQLCINYANERLQQKYVIDNFQSVKKEYEGEGKWGYVT